MGKRTFQKEQLYFAKTYSGDDVAAVRRALRVAALPEGWSQYFQERLEKREHS
jgi:hypothetical protein